MKSLHIEIKAASLRAILMICLLLACPSFLHATPQIPDLIEFDDKIFEFGRDDSPPLYKFLQQNLSKWPKEFPSSPSNLVRSNLWRGHIALYRVAQNKLWLVSLEVPVSDEDYDASVGRLVGDRPFAPFPLSVLFPECSGAVHVSWFTGDLHLTRQPSKAELEVDKSISTRHETLTFSDGVLMHATKPTIEVKPDSKVGR